MCGIAGKARIDGPPITEGLLASMCEPMVHRGPDSRGTHVDGHVGLAIQRLRVIDLETGDQPIYNETGTIAVVLNGEIYNYKELRAELREKGHTFRTSGDTEVIVHGFEEWGAQVVRRLHGMFAFAIWDSSERRLLLGRDRVGKKPLFYALTDTSIAFASELASLMADSSIPRELDPLALDAYFAHRYIPHPLSIHRAVRKLPPASLLSWKDGRATIERYWHLDYAAKRSFTDRREAEEELLERLRTAVKRRLLADVPVGAFLSGGIDSSGVVALMAEVSPFPVRTFSIGFPSERFNELRYARMIAERYGTDHHEFVVEPESLEMIPKVVRQYGEPFSDPSAIANFYLARLARQHITVALNGDGGDESFGGYRRYVANALLSRSDRVPRAMRIAAARLGERLPPSPDIASRMSKARRFATSLPLPAHARYRAYMTSLDGLDRRQLYTPEFAHHVDESATDAIIETAWREGTGTHVIDRMLETDVSTYLPGQLLVKADIASMAYSLEARSPLLDHELMEFAAALPVEYKVAGNEMKTLLRSALRPYVPDVILDRPKRGFELPLAEWFRGSLNTWLVDVVTDPAVHQQNIIDRSYVEGLLREHSSGTADHARRLWTIAVFAVWMSQSRDGFGERPAAAPMRRS